MKKLIVAAGILLTVAACHSAPAPAPAPMPGRAPSGAAVGNQTGAADPAAAVRGFLAATKAQDLQAISIYWGDQDGPARDAIPRQELEQRELVMVSCLQYDRFDIIGDAPGTEGSRVLAVALNKAGRSASTNFTTVMSNRDRRWYVKTLDFEKLMRDYCTKR